MLLLLLLLGVGMYLGVLEPERRPHPLCKGARELTPGSHLLGTAR